MNDDLSGLFFFLEVEREQKEEQNSMKSNMETSRVWLMIVVAAFFEVGWVTGLKHADSLAEWLGTVAAILISFYILIAAGTRLPAGTVYAVFVGLGTAGTVFADILLFGEPFKPLKLVLVMILLAGVIGLKAATRENPLKEES